MDSQASITISLKEINSKFHIKGSLQKKKCGFNPQGRGFRPDPHFLKSVDFLGGGGFLDPKSTLFRLFGPIFCYFSSNIGYIKFCENSGVELSMFYGWWV